MKCIAFSGRTVHQVEDQVNYFLEKNKEKIKVLNFDISITDNTAGGILIYKEEVNYD